MQFQRTYSDQLGANPRSLIQLHATHRAVLSCDSSPDPQLRIIINDGVVPLSSIRGCPKDRKHGMCPVPAFVSALREIVGATDWEWACHGDWEVAAGHEWNTTTGDPPRRF